jgi:DNA-binding transcriptional LysR family regulator
MSFCIINIVSGNLSTDNDAVIHGATIKGLGIAYSYPFLFNKEILDGTVTTILPEYTQFTIDIYAFYHPTPYLPMKSRAFIDAMSDHYQTIQEEVMARGKK